MDSGASDLVDYVNFRGGMITLPPGGVPSIHFGQKYPDAVRAGAACERSDRPCVTGAWVDGGRVRVAWQYGSADAFNVAWWPVDRPGSVTQREVAGYEFSIAGGPSGTAYVVEVAACHKRFLRRSLCTWPSARVITQGA